MAPGPTWKAPRALYVHVPFCRSKCAYCDFYSVAQDSCDKVGASQDEPTGAASSPASAYVDVLLEDLDKALVRFPPPAFPAFDSIYLGGGTPSALPPRDLRRLLEGIAGRTGGAFEWTMEANPESLSPEILDIACGAGVNRLSLGIQSLDDELLALLGRPARRAACEAALSLAAAGAGLRVSADLIAGLPRSPSLAAEVGCLLEHGIRHISIYDLVLEEGTPLELLASSGKLALLGEDEAAEERREAELLLEAAGLRRYEVSNWAVPGEECRHNLAYWHMDSYIGLGPGAVSTLQAEEGSTSNDAAYSLRIEEARDLESYVAGHARKAKESSLDLRDSAIECLMMGTRTIFGLDLKRFEKRFGIDPRRLFSRSLATWSEYLVPGLPWPGGDGNDSAGIALSSRGLDILNRFLVDCLEDMDGQLSQAPARTESRQSGR